MDTTGLRVDGARLWDSLMRMAEIGAEPIGNSADQMAQQIRSESDKFAKLVKDAKVTLE